MGKVSKAFIVIRLIPLVPAIILTIISIVFPTFFPDTPWFSTILRFFVIGLLYTVAFTLITLGLIIAKRDSE